MFSAQNRNAAALGTLKQAMQPSKFNQVQAMKMYYGGKHQMVNMSLISGFSHQLYSQKYLMRTSLEFSSPPVENLPEIDAQIKNIQPVEEPEEDFGSPSMDVEAYDLWTQEEVAKESADLLNNYKRYKQRKLSDKELQFLDHDHYQEKVTDVLSNISESIQNLQYQQLKLSTEIEISMEQIFANELTITVRKPISSYYDRSYERNYKTTCQFTIYDDPKSQVLIVEGPNGEQCFEWHKKFRMWSSSIDCSYLPQYLADELSKFTGGYLETF